MPKPQKTTLLYGYPFPSDADPLAIELAAIKALTEDPSAGKWEYRGRKCGMTVPIHVKNAMKLLWPDMYFHRWTDTIIEEFLKRTGRTACFGPSSSQKSYVFSRCGLVMFYARPHGTTVLITSTTTDALKRRIWGYVVESDKEARGKYDWLPGSLIESKTMMLADPATAENRSFKDGIIGVACKIGGQWRGLEAFVGCKNHTIILICDEIQFCSEGVNDSLANLESNERCYSALMGNLPNIQNPLATAAEPKIGWSSLPYTNKSRVYETRWQDGRAIQLIAMDSPNLDFPEGQEPYRNLIGRAYIERMANNYGRGTPKFAMFADGNIPTADMTNNVLNKEECIRHGATNGIIWSHHKLIRGYGMDAAYSGVGGDRTVGAPFAFGIDTENKWRFWIGQLKVYEGSKDAALTHSEAIALEAKRECDDHGIEPSHFFFDGTGRSELTSALARLWSPEVVPIEFGGMATERPSFTGEKHLDGEEAGNRKTCREVFDRFVSELWFAMRWCIIGDQMRGMSIEAIEEGSRRQWEIVRGAKYSVEPKDEMKERGLRSPDYCDCIVSAIEGARRLGFPLGNIANTKTRRTGWLDAERENEWERIKSNELEAA